MDGGRQVTGVSPTTAWKIIERRQYQHISTTRCWHIMHKPGGTQNPMTGRWSTWPQLVVLDMHMGTEWFFLQIVPMYWPCFLSRPLTTYQQHVQGLLKLHQFECPWKAILTDILKEMLSWQDMGDQIVLVTDFNNDITTPWVKRSWAANLGLVEAIMYLHPDGAPPTYQQGSFPIDSIFTAPQLLETVAGGYLSFSNPILSDHHAIWLNLHLPEVCPVHQEAFVKPQACCLQCKDPRIVDRYSTALLEMLEKQNPPQWIWELNDHLIQPSDLWRNIKRELNSINNVVMVARRGMENHCRKLKCSQVQWCPRVTAAINKKYYFGKAY